VPGRGWCAEYVLVFKGPKALASSEMMNMIKIDTHDAQDFIRSTTGSLNNRLNGLVLLE
jgi:hypothetical protein